MWLNLKSMHSKKLLVISGPTATGKTNFAQTIALKINSELISADSRQIYIGMDIGTGKDHLPGTKIHLVDIVTPDQTFSSFEFESHTSQKINQIQSKKALPILVGGTGHYVRSVLYPDLLQSPNVQSHFLFPVLNLLNIKILKLIFKMINKNSFYNQNHAEQNNPQRLVKRILVSLNPKKETRNLATTPVYDILHLHLDAPSEYLYSKIEQRVEKRLEQGLLGEIQGIVKRYSWNDPGLQTLAYQEFQPFFTETDTLENCIQAWTIHEKQYLKRQKTYFKKFFPSASTYDVTKPNWQDPAIKNVITWYNKT